MTASMYFLSALFNVFRCGDGPFNSFGLMIFDDLYQLLALQASL
jgi:hypothetical protein